MKQPLRLCAVATVALMIGVFGGIGRSQESQNSAARSRPSSGRAVTAGDRLGPPGRSAGDSTNFLARAGLKLGDPLPDVSGFDSGGGVIRLRELKGNYTVLVFGCLT